MVKKIIILIIIIIILIAGVGAYWYFYKKPQDQDSGKRGFLSRFFPFGEDRNLDGNSNNNPPIDNGDPGDNQDNQDQLVFSLRQISKEPTSGFGIASTTVRYVEKANGHIYEVEPNGNNPKRLSNATILKTFESFWSKEADKLVARYLEDSFSGRYSYPSIKTLSVLLKSATGTSTSPIESKFLPTGAIAITTSPFEDKIFYLDFSGDNTSGIVAGFDLKKPASILSIPFDGFIPNWSAKNIITLLTKPSIATEGFFYSLDAKTGKMEKIIGGMRGLTALLSPTGEKAIFGFSKNNGFGASVLNVKDKTVEDLGITTFPEKCVWSRLDKNLIYCAAPQDAPNGEYPDDWYQGLVSFDDSIWQINLATKETKVLTQTELDAINLLLTKDESYFVFTNKKDNTLWSLKLK